MNTTTETQEPSISLHKEFWESVSGEIDLCNGLKVKASSICSLFISVISSCDASLRASQAMTDTATGMVVHLQDQLKNTQLKKEKTKHDLRILQDQLNASRASLTITKLKLKDKTNENRADKVSLGIALQALEKTRTELSDSRAELEAIKRQRQDENDQLASALLQMKQIKSDVEALQEGISTNKNEIQMLSKKRKIDAIET